MEIKQNKNITIVSIPKTEIQTIDFVQCAEPKQTLEQFYQNSEIKPEVLMNGGFFVLASGQPVMDFIDNGKVKASQENLTYGIGITNNKELKFGKDTDGNWNDFLTAYPPLLVNGQYTTYRIGNELNYRARRSILGYNDNNVYFIAIDTPGANFVTAAQIAKEAGCEFAVNLDGGGSTRLLYNGTTYAAAKANRPVDNVIALYTKKQKVIYRVQVGAFSSKINANFYCELIKTLGENYKGAYVRYIQPYYKVQVGAFSVRKNAENMMNDLKQKGYNAFITT